MSDRFDSVLSVKLGDLYRLADQEPTTSQASSVNQLASPGSIGAVDQPAAPPAIAIGGV